MLDFSENQQNQDCFGEHLSVCPSLTAHGHLCDQGGEVQGCKQSVCGIMLAGCVFVVCLEPLGMGEDVRIDRVWIYGVIFFKDFHDLMV